MRGEDKRYSEDTAESCRNSALFPLANGGMSVCSGNDALREDRTAVVLFLSSQGPRPPEAPVMEETQRSQTVTCLPALISLSSLSLSNPSF